MKSRETLAKVEAMYVFELKYWVIGIIQIHKYDEMFYLYKVWVSVGRKVFIPLNKSPVKTRFHN